MKIALVQYSPIWESKIDNINNLNEMLKAIHKNIDLLIFPEMTLTGFTMNSKNYAEEIDGIGMTYFLNLAFKNKVNIVAGIIEKYEDVNYNSAFHFDEKGLIKAVYRKIHPFSYAEEDKNYKAGNEIVISKIDKYKMGLTICYDLRFPELYRLYAKEKVDVIINIANWPVKRIDHWKTLLKARAIENQCFIIGVNRVGNDPFNQYNGFTSIYDPMGNAIVTVENKEEIIYTEINLDETKNVRDKFHFLEDMKLI